MSSSCVPPKGCVVHNPDPSGEDDHDDSSSECGSLCTCTSGSVTSLATTITSRDPDRLGGDNNTSTLLTTAHQATAAATQPATQTTDGSNNSYFVMLVPSQIRDGSRCGTCRTLPFQSAFRYSMVTVCEFIPWLAGLVLIYYTFCWWGIGSSFSAFLFIMGAYAVLRFIKTRGAFQCSHLERERRARQVPEVQGEAREEATQLEAEAQVDQSAEKPPSYETAVVKPPPYDLEYHLTPTQPRSQAPAKQAAQDLLTVPQSLPPRRPVSVASEDDEQDPFLPSYHDAIRITCSSDTEQGGQGQS